MANMSKLDNVRKAIAAARSSGVLSKGGASLEEREAANALSRRVYRRLDACITDLNNLILKAESGDGEQQDTAEIKVRRRERVATGRKREWSMPGNVNREKNAEWQGCDVLSAGGVFSL